MSAERTARKRFVLRRWVSSLTWKALAFITVMCCGLAALLGALVHVSVTDRTVSDARSRALARLDGAVRAYEAGNRLPPDAALDARELPGPLRELAVSGRRGTMVGDAGGLPAMWAAAPADGGALAVRIDYAQSAATIENLDRAILGSSALAIGVTLAVGALGVTGVTRRLRTTSQVARRISAGDLDARVGDPRTADPSRYRDEVAAVAAALDTMASTLQRKLVGEQRFTADVAHELRTPLTGLHAAAELLPPGRPTELVRDRVAALRTLTEDLLEISRLDAGGERLDVDAIRLGVLAGRVAAHASGDTEVRVVEDACVETDRRRLERVLGNLVANAHKHGRPPVVVTVAATAEEAVVTVRDHGDGFPEYLVAEGPQRFRTEGSRKGHGLGLTIAVGQAEVLGARLRFENAADGGASAVLRLPAGGD
ncbi:MULTISPECIES: sensor histidine kinase [Streptomyces]|uniref:histidine kinase n=7 Tax=Streptomyces scabiei TaxID=1930 RepID=C9ZA66_STRSW|nr:MULTISPECIES: HAMP domain-containing sensor histidine kinase [Streptomyces]MBP5869908.1 HAMP domain-containing histidine kinase [Streptomyces sp. LBUM 1485]MBP5908290.1 HAMP domain-containing histidine kinase [Streptomyces sp. LBUM 1478]MBP5928693.1 HAMP domain-containing histidine kinase [Streptomyces sp. LBUM 1479]KFG04546.1 ATPase [Streptomyces scabiei]MBP5914119.1 HAMP domain-containing histidine kinase [Streptomyces sp. LBUM 1486]